MLTKVIKAINCVFLASFASVCNSSVEATQDIILTLQKPIFISIFSCIIIVPIVSAMLTIFSNWKNLAFKVSLQRYLYVALILMLALAWLAELNFAKNLSNTLNSELIIGSLVFQLLLVVGAYLSLKKQQTRDKKQQYFL